MSEMFDYTQAQALISPIDVRDYRGVSTAQAQDLPEEFELQRCPIKNQGGVGSCVAHSLASCAEYFNKIETGSYEQMSTGFIYGNRRNSSHKGSGMYVSKALSSLRHYGTTKTSQCDTNVEVPDAIKWFEEHYKQYAEDAYQNRITQYYRLSSIDSIKASIYQGCPVVFVLVFRTSMEIKNNIWLIDESSTKTGGSHCMYIYGWNKDGWKIANSWGLAWNGTGTVILPYSTKLAEAWGLQDTYNALKVSTEVNGYKKRLEILRKEYNNLYILDGEVLTDEHLKRAEEIEREMDSLERKIHQAQKDYIEIDRPFEKTQWLARIINAIINFFKNIFKKQ